MPAQDMPIFRHADSVLDQGIVQWVPDTDGQKPIVMLRESTVRALPIAGLKLKVGQLVALEWVGPAGGSAKTLRISYVIADTAAADNEDASPTSTSTTS